MSAKRTTWVDILIHKGVVGPDQVAEAQDMAKQTGTKLSDTLVRLGYATSDEVVRAMAEEHGHLVRADDALVGVGVSTQVVRFADIANPVEETNHAVVPRYSVHTPIAGMCSNQSDNRGEIHPIAQKTNCGRD